MERIHSWSELWKPSGSSIHTIRLLHFNSTNICCVRAVLLSFSKPSIMNQCSSATYLLLAAIVCEFRIQCKRSVSEALICSVFVYFVIGCAMIGQTAAENKPGCPVACTYIYEPVCATNGDTNKVFGNECSMRAANCYSTKGKFIFPFTFLSPTLLSNAKSNHILFEICRIQRSKWCRLSRLCWLHEVKAHKSYQPTNFVQILNNWKTLIVLIVKISVPLMCGKMLVTHRPPAPATFDITNKLTS